MAGGWRVPVVQKFKVFPLSEVENYGNSYLKEMIKTAPALLCMLVSMPVAFCILLGVAKFDANHGLLQNRPFKKLYTVYRPDDPMIERMMWRPAYYNHEGTVPHHTAPVRGKFQTE